ncbi:hypothetical protein SAMN05216343_10199 [Oscillibacter sp. PC13]|uniref:hypothetical protein n=1 Tax=Oscillibacter sp. PC13 TaxID=1855299 RepID=UPI0008E35BBD|nr:hypothetical protein [Oscillibacter sp. PC13]SFO95093.1 hypothetical protein SAMN05216343_10199 [Oscillibacter sp. PC13]
MKARMLFLLLGLALAGALALTPRERTVDIRIEAMEYAFSDAGVAVPHVVFIQGTDRRNLLGRGSFSGTLTIDDGVPMKISSPLPGGEHSLTGGGAVTGVSVAGAWNRAVLFLQAPLDGNKTGCNCFLDLGNGREAAVKIALAVYDQRPASPSGI